MINDPLYVDPPLPPITEILRNYLGGTNSAVYRCLEDRVDRWKKDGSSYRWNSHFNGRKLDRLRAGRVILPANKAPLAFASTTRISTPQEPPVIPISLSALATHCLPTGVWISSKNRH